MLQVFVNVYVYMDMGTRQIRDSCGPPLLHLQPDDSTGDDRVKKTRTTSSFSCT